MRRMSCKRMAIIGIFSAVVLFSGKNAQAETLSFGSDGNMFAPNCFCKEDVKKYDLAPWCGTKNSCNGETDSRTAVLTDGDYKVTVKLGSLTDHQKYEEVIVYVNGKAYSVPDLGGNSSSTGTATYSLGIIHLSGAVKVSARHKYADVFTGKWYSDESSRIGGVMESVLVESVVFDKIAVKNPINGKCGSADGKTFSEKPNDGFCASGKAGSVAGNGPWSWSCVGLDGGTAASCSAQKIKSPEVPFCGNKKIEGNEKCDDGNNKNGDGCSATCAIEEKKIEDDDKDDEDDDEEERDCDGTIGDYVWLDQNGDGIQDADEKGLSGVTVHLSKGGKEWTEHTNKNGKYEFEDLCKGSYSVSVKKQDVEQYTQTYDPDGKLNNKTDVKLTKDSDSHKKADFGYKKRSVPVTGPGEIAFLLSGFVSAASYVSYRKMKKAKNESLKTPEEKLAELRERFK